MKEHRHTILLPFICPNIRTKFYAEPNWIFPFFVSKDTNQQDILSSYQQPRDLSFCLNSFKFGEKNIFEFLEDCECELRSSLMGPQPRHSEDSYVLSCLVARVNVCFVWTWYTGHLMSGWKLAGVIFQNLKGNPPICVEGTSDYYRYVKALSCLRESLILIFSGRGGLEGSGARYFWHSF